MNVLNIIREAQRAGLSLSLGPSNTVIVKGPRRVLNAWRTHLKCFKDSIRAQLLGINDSHDSPHRWWRIHQTDQPPTALCCHPEKTLQEIKCLYPNALRIEQYEPQSISPSRPLSTDEEMAIRRWLAQIKETDEDTIKEVLQKSNSDLEARKFFLSQTGTLQAEY